MNVPVPLSDSPYGFLVIGGTSLLVAGITGYWLWKRRMF
jgi:LPXTG-motif cell wall-anchored protein